MQYAQSFGGGYYIDEEFIFIQGSDGRKKRVWGWKYISKLLIGGAPQAKPAVCGGTVMKEQLRYGRLAYLSFIFIDIICLVLSNYLASLVYLEKSVTDYGYDDYRSVMIFMLLIDLGVTGFMNTLNRVQRRRKRKEIIEGIKHVGTSFVVLAVVLFTLRQGAAYSRVTVYLAYGIYFIFFVGSHMLWKTILKWIHKKEERETAILMTTDRFVDEGLQELEKLKIKVKYLYLLKNINKDRINGVPVAKTWEEAASVICWDWIDRVYIYGLDHQMVPENLISACKEMGLNFNLVDFNYRIIDIKTIKNEEPKYGALSFLEGKRDIPFPIRRAYWITETEADFHRGFHAHKLNCQLLYCPYGKIDIILDDGQKKTIVTLDKPGKGLILMPGLWREMVWQESGSVLCVLASEYYDAEEYIRNYDEFIAYNKRYRESANPLKYSEEGERLGNILPNFFIMHRNVQRKYTTKVAHGPHGE